MHLYNLSLLSPSAITQAVVGAFSATVDKASGKLRSLLKHNAFGVVRSLASFRLTGGTKDYLIVGSDAGRIVVLEYDAENNVLVKLHQETFGKSGSRRIVPGQYLAVDPKGRSVMVAAMEKAKLVYVLNRDQAANLTISSPLEAHKQHGIIHSIVGVDVGFENPLYAALEVDYSEADQDPSGEAFKATEKMLTYYELDLGLNHVVRRWSEPTDSRANLLVALPGGQSATSDHYDGPSGVLVCAENYIIYKHQGVPEHRVPIPKRETPLSDPDRNVIIVNSVMHKMKGDFFVLVQSEEGDLFKVTVDREEEEVIALKIKYFDTVPPASSMCILKSGFLFVASEYGNPHVYQFDKLGDEGDEVNSRDYKEFGATGNLAPAFFRAKPLENLILVDEPDSLAPIIDARTINVLGADAPQILAACGRGGRSSLRMLQHGLEVEELVSSPLGFAPTGIWSTKLKGDDEFDSYIVLSAPNATYVLSIGESIEQVSDSNFVENSRTLAVQQLGADSVLQVHGNGFVRLRTNGRREPWPEAGSNIAITAATTNERQIVLATRQGELVYFEVDNDGELNEYMERKALGASVTTMSISTVPEGRQRTPFLAVGCDDQTVRIISLSPENCMDTLSIQALTNLPSSICVVEMIDAAVDKNRPTLFVNIGLQNGVLLRTALDSTTNQLTDTRTRFLGSRSISIRRALLRGAPAVIALSSRTWVNYTHQGLLQFDPLIFDSLDHVCALSAEVCPEGIMGIQGETLRIFTLPKLGNKVKQDSMPLSYTPRRMAVHPTGSMLYLAETDHRVVSPASQEVLLAGVPDPDAYRLPTDVFGLPRASSGRWASCVRVVDPLHLADGQGNVQQIDLDNNEAAFCIAVVTFATRSNDAFLVVGTAKDTVLSPRSCASGYLRTYSIGDGGRSLQLLHVTELDDVPTVLIAYQGRLIAAVGRALRLFEMGKKKLLRKCENKQFPTAITSLQTQGSRLIVGDMQESIFFVTYKPTENRLMVFADDGQPRWVTCTAMLDYDTVVAGDKFGNVFVNRLERVVGEDVDRDPSGQSILHEKGFLMGSAHKTQMLVHFNVGDILTSIQKVSLVAGGREVILYTGFNGTVGMLVPFASSEDVDFFQTLEMHMRAEHPSIIGREHLSYRGYYAACKAVVDGDLCESFARLPMTKQAQIAQELDRSLAEVLRKIDQVRTVSSGW